MQQDKKLADSEKKEAKTASAIRMLMAHSRIYPLQNQEVVINNKTMIKIWKALKLITLFPLPLKWLNIYIFVPIAFVSVAIHYCKGISINTKKNPLNFLEYQH